jgi:bifunctional non-homologous end joining protein LigD
METSLYYAQGSSDKEYHIQLEKKGRGYVVNFKYGRRGSSLKSGTKTTAPIPLEDAQKIYSKLLKEKMSGGYVEGSNTNSIAIDSPEEGKPIHCLPQLLNPIEDPDKYIKDDNFVAQEKLDGERRIVSFDGEITQYNRKGKAINTITDLKKSIKTFCVLDGEMVGEIFFAFDILSFEGRDLTKIPLTERLVILGKQKFGKAVRVVSTAISSKEKLKLFNKMKEDSKEGIVFKNKLSSYTSGRPASGGDQLKFKLYKTATFIVSNITKNKRSVGLELNNEKNERVFFGKVTIPPNYDVPKVGQMIEVRYLYAYKNGAVFQPTYLGVRNDLDPSEASTNQIVYKNEGDE